jgi:hypothetical protein
MSAGHKNEPPKRRASPSLACRIRYSEVQLCLWDDRCSFWHTMATESRLFVVARNKCIVPKQRRIERVPSGYAVREFYDNPQGRYWYVVTNLEVVCAKKRNSN